MFSKEMINSSLETTKRSPRTVNNKNNIKIQLGDFDSEIFNVDHENFESVSRIIKPSSSALIPPWIKNSLCINEKNSLGPKVGNSSSLVNRNQEKLSTDELPVENLKPFEESNIWLSEETEDTEQIKSFIEVNIKQETDFTENSTGSLPNQTLSMVVTKTNPKEPDNPNQTPHERKSKLVKAQKTSIDVVMNVDPHDLQQQKLLEEDKKKTKTHKQKIKTKKRSYDEHKSEDVVKSDFDIMLEKKAREILEKFLKKDMLTLNPEESPGDGKPPLPNGKIREEGIKLGEEDLQFLKELKEHIGSKENVDKVMEIAKNSDSKVEKKKDEKHVCEKHRSKPGHEEKEKQKEKAKDKDNNKDKIKEKEKDEIEICQQMIRSDMGALNKDMVLSADEENDIKRFSEFLSKNKNSEEKRKCLEEVRTYFEKKRWSQVERQVKRPEAQSMPIITSKKESKTKEKEKSMNVNEPSEEIVEKAVTDTLHKFTELYRFQIPGNVIDDMKKSIVDTIKSENTEPANRKNLEGISLIFELKDGFDAKNSSLSLIDSRFNCNPVENNEISVFADEGKDSFTKKNPFKTLIDTKNEKKSSKEIEIVENENIKELRKEFEHCLETIQAQVDMAGAKLYSVVFEKADGDLFTRRAKLVYNFSKEGEALRISYDGDKPSKIEITKKSTKTQTSDDSKKKTTVAEKNVQTSEKKMIKASTQTDWLNENPSAKISRSPEGDHEATKPIEKDKIISNILDPKEQPVSKKSKELSLSDKGFLSKKSKKLDRSIKSDILGVNKQPPRYSEHKKRGGDVTSVNYLFLKQEQQIAENIFKHDPPQVKSLMDGDVNGSREDGRITEDPGCMWLWNGKKIDPGVDLKIQVEELMKEKLKELIETNKSDAINRGCPCGKINCECGNIIGGTSTDGFSTSLSSSERNLEVKKVDGKFCFSRSVNSEVNEEPFVFTAESTNLEENEAEKEAPNQISYKRERTISISQTQNTKKEYREVGTQNSQQTFVSKSNVPRLATKSKGKIHRLKHKKPRSLKSDKLERKTAAESPKSVAVAKKVSETKKAKLEVDTKANDLSNDSTQSLTNSGYDDSIISHTTSTATSEDMTEKIQNQNQNQDLLTKICSQIKNEEKEEVKVKDSEDKSKSKQWDLIENVLSRVNQKEKESLWNDIRKFVKTKIGRDINDEGAKEVCIEIEQDMPKHKKGKANQTIVAKGNYSPNEGDVEVEVDLTLDDLERILRHRQKKLKKRPKSITRFDSKQSSTSLEEAQRYQTFLNSVKALGGEYITESELKILKDKQS